MRGLGTYELREDAARAHEKVARILGRSGLNFPNSDALEITGWMSEGSDKALAAAVETARTFVAVEAAKKNKTSAPACQVRRGRNTAHGVPTHRTIHEHLMSRGSNRGHRRWEGIRSIRGYTYGRVQDTGSRKSR